MVEEGVAGSGAGSIHTEDIFNEGDVDFSQLLLSPPVTRGLLAAGFVKPSPVQLRAIPLGRLGTDLIVQAKSGTGKTCVFSVIVLEHVVVANAVAQALILAPTREIAVQINEVLNTVGQFVEGLKSFAFVGGLPLKQDRAKARDCHVLVGTPGRIKDLLHSQALRAATLRCVVLDEADQLFQSTFDSQVSWVLNQLPARRQTMMFSATYTAAVLASARKHMREPQFLMLSADSPSLIGVKQYHRVVEGSQSAYHLFQAKLQVLLGILAEVPFHQCVVFFNNRGKASELVEALNDASWEAVCIDGDMPQAERQAAMSLLRDFKVRVLVSTDLTSRGVDVSRISLVINFDLPQHPATYLHRVGRTGRFGTLGVAISLVAKGEEFTRLVLFGKLFNCGIGPMPDNPHDIPIDYLNGRVLSEREQKAAEALEAKKVLLQARAAQALLEGSDSDGGDDDGAGDGDSAGGMVAVVRDEAPAATTAHPATLVSIDSTPKRRPIGGGRGKAESAARHKEPGLISDERVEIRPVAAAKVDARPAATKEAESRSSASSLRPATPMAAASPFQAASVQHLYHSTPQPTVPQVAASPGHLFTSPSGQPAYNSTNNVGHSVWAPAPPAPLTLQYLPPYAPSPHTAPLPPCHCRDCLWSSALAAASSWRRTYSPSLNYY
jgi:superfamily II DNA/RNA helicase